MEKNKDSLGIYQATKMRLIAFQMKHILCQSGYGDKYSSDPYTIDPDDDVQF